MKYIIVMGCLLFSSCGLTLACPMSDGTPQDNERYDQCMERLKHQQQLQLQRLETRHIS